MKPVVPNRFASWPPRFMLHHFGLDPISRLATAGLNYLTVMNANYVSRLTAAPYLQQYQSCDLTSKQPK